jgi:hypothetical protein
MGRYYDVKEIIKKGTLLGESSSFEGKPKLSKDETLVGIVVWTDGKVIDAIAPNLSQKENYYGYWCKEKIHANKILCIQLYKLNNMIADKIMDAPAVRLVDFNKNIEKPFSDIHVQEYFGLAATLNNDFYKKLYQKSMRVNLN